MLEQAAVPESPYDRWSGKRGTAVARPTMAALLDDAPVIVEQRSTRPCSSR